MQGIAGAALLALALTACGGAVQSPPQTPSSTTSHTSQPAPTTPSTQEALACKLAMVKQFQEALNSSKTGTRPEECKGIDDKTVQKYAEEILSEAFDGGTETKTS
jgi:hypothetical protein